MKYSTLFEYLILNIDEKYNISEAKADVEYERNFTSIPRDVFDAIVLMDPKTERNGDTIGNIGFGSKQLLLPKYVAGETDFIDNAELITNTLNAYYSNIANYPKFNEFKTLADFLSFMENPDGAEIEKAEQQTHMDKVYNKYYSSIDRDIFNKIIAMDPKTTSDTIGDVAKNLLLAKYMQGETEFLDDAESVKIAIDTFYRKGHNYPNGKDTIQGFESVEEFITYKPTSPTVADIAAQGLQEGRDYKIIASSAHYDVFKSLNFEASRIISHARGGANVWCTGGGSDGNRYTDEFFISYSPGGSKRTHFYTIISKINPTDRLDNYNLAISEQNQKIYEFRDGNNNIRVGDNGSFFKSVFVNDAELVQELVNCSDPVMKNCKELLALADILKYSEEPLYINSSSDFAKFFSDIDNSAALRNCVKEIHIKNVDNIPFGAFAGYHTLSILELGDGIKTISAQAFKNCSELRTLSLPETLESIGPEAFAGCAKLKGSVRIPDSLVEIGQRAFADTHCRLKIDRNRTKKLKMSPKDMDWIKVHVQSIKL